MPSLGVPVVVHDVLPCGATADFIMTKLIIDQINLQSRSKMAGTAKKTDLGLLEEDDEFEEFPAEGILCFGLRVIVWKYRMSLDNFKSLIS